MACRFGELDAQWVAFDTWNWSAVWSSAIHPEAASAKEVLLMLEGVDTHAHVGLNGKHVSLVDNYHR